LNSLPCWGSLSAQRKGDINSNRLEAFSDGVIAIIMDSLLKKAVRGDWKGKVSPILYLVGVGAAFWDARVAEGVYTLVAMLWFAPDRRIENVLAHE